MDNRANLEIIAPSVEEAVAKGLADLGLPEDAVEVEILDQGSRGLFGLGSRHARVRLTVKSGEGIAAGGLGGETTDGERKKAPRVETAAPVEEKPAAPRKAPQPAPEKPRFEKPAAAEAAPEKPAERPVPPAPDAPARTRVAPSMDKDFELQVARDVVNDLIEKMKVRATVTARYGDTDEDRSRTPMLVEVNGDDLSILIGRRAETLNALQYISTLMVSKELGHPVSLAIDVQGYRSRREGQLRQLARRMAEQAVKSGRRQVLEPMPASERRIVHIELRGHPDVTTESVGDEPRRKVTIVPKNQ